MDFFQTRDTGIKAFELFDMTHCGWLLATVLAAVGLCVFHRRSSPSRRRNIQRTLGLATFGIYAAKQVVLVILGEYGIGYLPLHLCGMSVYIELIDCLFPSRFTRELCYSLCMPGALMGILFANWTGYPIFSMIHITSFLLHGMMIIYPLLALTGGDHRPSLKRLPACFGFLLAVAIPVYFFNRHFRTNYMFLRYPSPGSPLEWCEKLLGNPGYLLGFAVMIAAVWALMYAPFVIADCVRRKRGEAAV